MPEFPDLNIRQFIGVQRVLDVGPDSGLLGRVHEGLVAGERVRHVLP